MTELYQQAMSAAWIGLFSNISLALIKIVAGLLGHSIAMIADALNSLGDTLGAAGVLYGLRLAKRPPDANHPYGHSRAETVAALTIAVLIAMSAIGIGVEAIRGFTSQHPIPPAWVLWIALGNIVVKEVIYRYQRRIAERTSSSSLLAAAWDHRSDAICSTAVFVGLAVVRFSGGRYLGADDVAALAVVSVILVAAVRIYLLSASKLMDEQCGEEVCKQITRIAASIEGIHAIEQVRARRSGLEVHVDLHIEVDPALTVEEGHTIGHHVQEALIRKMPAVSQVLVHVEPAFSSS